MPATSARAVSDPDCVPHCASLRLSERPPEKFHGMRYMIRSPARDGSALYPSVPLARASSERRLRGCQNRRAFARRVPSTRVEAAPRLPDLQPLHYGLARSQPGVRSCHLSLQRPSRHLPLRASDAFRVELPAAHQPAAARESVCQVTRRPAVRVGRCCIRVTPWR